MCCNRFIGETLVRVVFLEKAVVTAAAAMNQE